MGLERPAQRIAVREQPTSRVLHLREMFSGEVEPVQEERGEFVNGVSRVE